MRFVLVFIAGLVFAGCYYNVAGSEPNAPNPTPTPPPPTPGPNTLVVEFDQNYLGACSGGWVTIVFDPSGRQIPSQPGQALWTELNGSWQGFVMIGARCGADRYYVWSPNLQSHLASEGGAIRISLGADDLTRSGALICPDPYTPGVTRPTAPLGLQNRFHCPTR